MPKLPRRTPKDAKYFLRILRAERAMSQMDAAKAFGVSRSFWSLLEDGQRNASPVLAEALATATGAPIEVFLFAREGRTA